MVFSRSRIRLNRPIGRDWPCILNRTLIWGRKLADLQRHETHESHRNTSWNLNASLGVTEGEPTGCGVYLHISVLDQYIYASGFPDTEQVVESLSHHEVIVSAVL